MTPPLKRPNSAGGALVSTLNSWMASIDREERHLSRLGLQHGDAVEEVFVDARPSAVDAREGASPGGSATPGTSVTREKKLRPFSGSCTMRRFGMTWPRLLDSVCSSDASAVTVGRFLEAADRRA